MIVQAYLYTDVSDHYSRQRIGDCIILTSDVFDGHGTLRNVGQMSLLASRPGVGPQAKAKVSGLRLVNITKSWTSRKYQKWCLNGYTANNSLSKALHFLSGE